MYQIVAVGLIALTVPVVAFTAEPRTKHTYQLGDEEQRPEATLNDARWLAGSWSGTGFGQQFEEVWNAPSADSMVGMFKLMSDDGVSFYEIMLLTVEDGTLSLKVKHFNADFTAWEDKADFVNFRLVMKERDALHFGGISFYRRDANNMDAYIVMRNGDEIDEQHLAYTRLE